MLKVIQDLQDPLLELVKQDPVRPHICLEKRIGKNAQVLVLLNEQNSPQSVVCLSFTNEIPTEEQQLFVYDQDNPTIAVMYSIWSVERGGGQALISQIQNYIRTNCCTICRLITLSPLTQMAHRFHIKNGAQELQVNANTQNFEYNLT